MVGVKTVLPLLFFLAATALVIEKRDFTVIVNDIKTIDKNVNSVTAALDAWKGRLDDAFPIFTAVLALDGSLKQGTVNAKVTPPIGPFEAKELENLAKVLKPHVKSLLDGMIVKKPLFDQAFVTYIVRNEINMLRKFIDKYANALITILPLEDQASGRQDKALIDAYFDIAARFYKK